MKEWKKVNLNDFVWFQRGFDLPREKFEDGNVPVYGSTSILGFHNVSKVKAPGIITGRSGTLGKFQFAEEDYWPHNTSLWVKDFKGNNPKFAFYLLQCLDFSLFNSGGAVPTLNRNVLNAFKVNVPQLPTQRIIASILSAYDDLIENNLKRIKLLEELAQRTYEEWFVKFKVNGEQLEVNEETGLPEGWERKKLKEVANINKKSIKKSFKGNLKYVDISSVSTGKIDSFTEYEFEDAPGRARRIVLHGDIIWSCVRPNRKSYSIIWNPEENLIASTGFAVITPKALPSSYLYQFVTTDAFVGYLTSLASGAAYPAVTSNVFEEAEIVVPVKDTVDLFDMKFKPVQDSISNLLNQNRYLKESRDMLLPRLMSGVINVDSDTSTSLSVQGKH